MSAANSLTVAEGATDDEILATYAVMSQLRPHISPDAYLPTVRRMMQSDGYRLASVYEAGHVRAVAGYRFMDLLSSGRVLYVDDLSTDEAHRSRGCGRALIAWLKDRAREAGCTQIHLCSGVHRAGAHRFYFRERFVIGAYHFKIEL